MNNLGKQIRQLRKQAHLTQEQVAKHLGVSGPAVSKWEQGLTCPDIQLLPALARLFDTDVNHLLSFKEKLTTIEIQEFIGKLLTLVEVDGLAAVVTTIEAKINEFPNDLALIYNVTGLLQGMVGLTQDKTAQLVEKIQQLAEKNFLHLVKAEDSNYQQLALAQLFQIYLEREDFTQAEAMLVQLQPVIVSPKDLQAKLYLKQKKTAACYQCLEENLLQTCMSVLTNLELLKENALQSKQLHLADYYRQLSVQLAPLFEVPDYSDDYYQFEAAIKQQKKAIALKNLKKLLTELQQPWQTSQTKLYQHLSQNSSNEGNQFNQLMFSSVIDELHHDSSYDFLKDDAEFQDILTSFKGEN
ncbi:transcriptional regulator with XRE-family HTH domain [Enterococcus sp. PF1-24]|uniref:helix-turn-helix domain-containing protein n=1 Tax=unclassified Enterococcus TaxID=2608891 RepID=UPI0024769FCB|nr:MULTISPECIES: helix-turn-helix transcriptional regulator [unclassified Enterococcus]MDH6364120.1 transcriptional regulator with XRE-family HTH domain [Enterococcus sp. PFB1-1]MDH6401221.1 transcriptional regulator with XRE-family HTH domain [Enterococcus sp. PF1-24]